jgi:hypothetical protein
MIAKNKNLQKSLLILLILILPASIYTYTPFAAQSPTQAFASNTQGGTQGGGTDNTTIATPGGGNTTIATLNPNYTSATPIIK